MKILLLAICATLSSSGTVSAHFLRGFSMFSADAQGRPTGDVWNTAGGDGVFNLYLYYGDTLLNPGDSSSSTHLRLYLNEGIHTFHFRAQPGTQSTGYFGLNTFIFDADSVALAALVTANSGSFVANDPVGTPTLDGQIMTKPWGGRIFYSTGDRQFTLLSFSQGQGGGNTVGRFTDTPGPEGGDDYRGSFTIFVETPEPSTYGMLGMGLVGLAVLRRRRP